MPTGAVFILIWYYIFRTATRYGNKIPVILAVIWLTGFMSNTLLGIVGPVLFTSFEAVRTFFLISYDFYKKNQSTQTKPLHESLECQATTLWK